MIKTFKENQKGSVMIEALAMLGLIAMVTPMLYRKAAERTTELQDINVASQIRMVSAAVDAYLKDNYTNLAGRGNTFLIRSGSGATATEQADYEGVSAYLPEGFNLDQASKLFEGFEIAVKKDTATDLDNNTHNVFTSAVVANLKDDMTKMRAAKIASMIGTNGGMVNVATTGTEENPILTYTLNGTQGTWEATPDAFGFDADPGWRDNSLVSISTEAISSAIGDVGSDEALFRIWNGNTGFNTMETSLYFAGNNNVTLELQGHDINGVNHLIAEGATIGREGLRLGGTLDMGENPISSVGDITSYGEFGGISVRTKENIISQHGDIIAEEGGVAGVKISAGTGGITTSGNLVMGRNDIEEIRLAQGKEAQFINITGTTIVATGITASGITAQTINASGATLSGVTMAGDIEMDGHNIYHLGVIKMNDSNSSIDMREGEINRVGSIDGEFANFSYITGDTVTARSILATGITSSGGYFHDLHVVNDLTVGGTSENAGTNLEVGGNRTLIKTTYLGVGKSASGYSDDVNKIVVDPNQSFFGYHYGKKIGVSVKSDMAAVGINTESGLGFFSYPRGNAIAHENSAMSVNNSGFGFYRGASAANLSTIAATGFTIKGNEEPALGTNSKVVAYISRDGALELLSPGSNGNGQTTGFIRARRLVSDVKYDPDKFGSLGSYAYSDYSSQDKFKDRYYEVNPAYTSIMNDIKLASRGGARLSDILPDYIDKGIYVADNTYEENVFWEDENEEYKEGIYVTGQGWTMSGATECGDGDAYCETSPWLGFVPAPLCPPAYESVITLEPIRWKMAEAYSFSDPNYTYAGGSDVSGAGFRNVFWANRNPEDAMTITVSEDGGGAHTASIGGTYPLVFQTNTWLNTSVYPYTYANDYTQGWHAVMGFLYDSSYADMYKRRTGNNMVSGKLVWNLFPVYTQELAAIARVYCSFRRYKNEMWTWGGGTESPVFQYDQLDNYKTDKDDSWVTQVNDPTLVSEGGYKPEW